MLYSSKYIKSYTMYMSLKLFRKKEFMSIDVQTCLKYPNEEQKQ